MTGYALVIVTAVVGALIVGSRAVKRTRWWHQRKVRGAAEKSAAEELRLHAWAHELRNLWIAKRSSARYPDAPRGAWVIATRSMDSETAWDCLTWLATTAARTSDSLREEALDEAVSRFRGKASQLLRELLTDPADRVKVAAIVHLGRLRNRQHAGEIVALLPRLGPGGRHAVARAVSRMGAEEQEPALIRLLGDATPRVAEAAAESLGWIGSIAAVEPLQKLGGDVALRAVSRIQARARGDVGRISIAEDGEAGKLSPAERAGAVTLTGKK